MNTKIGILLLLCFVTMAAQCSSCTTDKNGTTPGGYGYCNDANPVIQFGSESTSGTDLICNYGPVNVQAPNCTLVRTTVSGTGTTPSAVNVTRANSTANIVGALPSFSGAWTTNGAALNCSVLGCPTGDYSVSLTIPNGAPGSCPSSITLALDIQ